MVILALLYAIAVWQRRWIADDGLIVVRTVRQILAGHGPTFNAFERVEADTSPLWTWLVALAAWISHADVAHVAVALGGALAVVGVVLALDTSRRFHQARGADSALLPAGILVVLGVYPFWDYGTSGLETGLELAWLALAWRVLILVDERRIWSTAVVLGLGPLVRPDFALVSFVFFVALCVLERPRPKRLVALLLVTIALPLAYEIFRAGYYGVLVPMPALTKSASSAEWSRGLAYLRDYAHPYLLWFPVLALVAGTVVEHKAVRTEKRLAIGAGAAWFAALMVGAFVIRVGGDFMHARMLLPATFLAVLPVAMLPARRRGAVIVVVLAGWCVVTVLRTADGQSHATIWPIEDERAGYVAWTGRAHPIDGRPFRHANQPYTQMVRNALAEHRRELISEDGFTVPLADTTPGDLVFAVGRLGTGGATLSVEEIVADNLGLANPIGARITPTNPGFPGHEKYLPRPWITAQFARADLDAVALGVAPGELRAARHALSCGVLSELVASTQAPLTPGRFWSNLTGAWRRTRIAIPSDAIDAEWAFCREAAREIRVRASSSYRGDGWSPEGVVDGIGPGVPAAPGYSSAVGNHADHTEWLELQFPAPRQVADVTLEVTNPDFFPRSVAIQLWDGSRWVDVAAKTDLAPEATRLDWPAQTTTKLRVVGSHLQQGRDGFLMQLAEIELR